MGVEFGGQVSHLDLSLLKLHDLSQVGWYGQVELRGMVQNLDISTPFMNPN